MKVREVMTTSVASVRRNEALSSAAKLMWDCDCGSIPVRDDQGERIVGMITDRDICMATWSRDSPPSSILVSEAMSSDLYFTSPDESISAAEALMRSRRVRRVPVLENGQNLVGIISLADIATESKRRGHPSGNSELAPAEVVALLADLSEPRSNQRASTPSH